jgi:hypothetical protein
MCHRQRCARERDAFGGLYPGRRVEIDRDGEVLAVGVGGAVLGAVDDEVDALDMISKNAADRHGAEKRRGQNHERDGQCGSQPDPAW